MVVPDRLRFPDLEALCRREQEEEVPDGVQHPEHLHKPVHLREVLVCSRLIDFLYHPTLGSRVIKKKKKILVCMTGMTAYCDPYKRTGPRTKTPQNEHDHAGGLSDHEPRHPAGFKVQEQVGAGVLSRTACECWGSKESEFIDYKTSIFTDQDPLRGLLFYQDPVSLTHYTFLKGRQTSGQTGGQTDGGPEGTRLPLSRRRGCSRLHFVLQYRVVCEKTPGPSRPRTPAGGLSTWSCWSCNQ